MSVLFRHSPLPPGFCLARADVSMGGGTTIDAGPLPDEAPDGTEMVSNLEALIGSAGRVRQSLITIAEAQKKLAQTSSVEKGNVVDALSRGVEETDAGRDGIVVEEWQKGYRFGERMLRPSRVKVGKAAERSEGA